MGETCFHDPLLSASLQDRRDAMDARVDELPFDLVFSIGESFDPVAASQLRTRLAELAPDRCVLLDFSHAREVSDLALGLLAMALVAPRHPQVILRGMMRHQERMLRYLGVDRPIGDGRSGEDLAV